MSIKEELEALSDDVSNLEKIYAKYRSRKSLLTKLVLLVSHEEPKIQSRATWLLKRFAQDKAQFKASQLNALFDSLAGVAHWESKLHLCQMLPYVRVPRGSETKVAWFLERNLLDENKFLRAWAYSGLYELARQHPKYREYAIEQLDRAKSEKSAAVKARIRKVRKAMNLP